MPTIQQLVRKGRQDKVSKTKAPALKGSSAASRRVHARLHDDPEEAELCSPQGRPCPPHLGYRNHRLHPRCRATTCKSTPSSWSAEVESVISRCPLQGRPGRPRHPGREEPQAGPVSYGAKKEKG